MTGPVTWGAWAIVAGLWVIVVWGAIGVYRWTTSWMRERRERDEYRRKATDQ